MTMLTYFIKYLTPVRIVFLTIVYITFLLTCHFMLRRGRGIETGETDETAQENWILKIFANLLSYSLLLLPFLLLRCITDPLLESWRDHNGLLTNWLRNCIFVCFSARRTSTSKSREISIELPILSSSKISDANFPPTNSPVPLGYLLPSIEDFLNRHPWLLLLLYAFGLNAVYIVWGVLQERIMTQSYDGAHFHEAQFMVFGNRVGALLVALFGFLLLKPRNESQLDSCPVAPLSSYAMPALSNIISSWCQYEALLFITFPTQVISKSCKIVPVMLVGRILHRRSYSLLEYTSAVLISVGVALVVLTTTPDLQKEGKHAAFNSVSGLVIISAYILFDSFSSTYQENLFRTYKMPVLHMMIFSSLWAILFTFLPLVEQNTLFDSLRFAVAHPAFARDSFVSAVCSGFGQVLIFSTISRFGAAVFVTIMTVRQALSVLLSCFLFHHPIHLTSSLGFILIFLAIFSRVCIRKRRAIALENTNENKQ